MAQEKDPYTLIRELTLEEVEKHHRSLLDEMHLIYANEHGHDIEDVNPEDWKFGIFWYEGDEPGIRVLVAEKDMAWDTSWVFVV